MAMSRKAGKKNEKAKSANSAKGKAAGATLKKFTSPRISKDLIKWCKENNVTLKSGCHSKKGDIVICSDGGKNFFKPCVIGRVLFRCPAGSHKVLKGKKGKPHPDGDKGAIFVLDWRKQKKPRGRLASKCHIRNYYPAPLHLHKGAG